MSVEDIWYQGHPLAWLLLPLSWIYGGLMRLRRLAYRKGWLQTQHLEVPVIVVGNITVGGTGKTPLVIALVERLRAAGLSPGVVSRGYGGAAQQWPQAVTAKSDPAWVGDEPVLIARRSGAPLVAAPDRVAAARQLCAEHLVDVVVSDDGLQHWALGRDVEIAVLDGERRLGNGWLLPAGPLREPSARLNSVDAVIVNGAATDPGCDVLQMSLAADTAVRLTDGHRRALAGFRGERVHALAGIGNPNRFYDALEQLGIEIKRHEFSDHHAYRQVDLRFEDERPILMTEKDAVKCQAFADRRMWFVPVNVQFDDDAEAWISGMIQNLRPKDKNG